MHICAELHVSIKFRNTNSVPEILINQLVSKLDFNMTNRFVCKMSRNQLKAG